MADRKYPLPPISAPLSRSAGLELTKSRSQNLEAFLCCSVGRCCKRLWLRGLTKLPSYPKQGDCHLHKRPPLQRAVPLSPTQMNHLLGAASEREQRSFHILRSPRAWVHANSPAQSTVRRPAKCEHWRKAARAVCPLSLCGARDEMSPSHSGVSVHFRETERAQRCPSRSPDVISPVREGGSSCPAVKELICTQHRLSSRQQPNCWGVSEFPAPRLRHWL